jgi:hypothetical protein
MSEPDEEREAWPGEEGSLLWAVAAAPMAAADVETINSLRLIFVFIGRPPRSVSFGAGLHKDRDDLVVESNRIPPPARWWERNRQEREERQGQARLGTTQPPRILQM